jgi:hypothetical protein
MRKILILLSLVLSLLFYCEKEVKDLDVICKQEHFYYTYNEKYYIDSLMQKDYLLIGFEKTYLIEEINEFLNSQVIFNSENLVERFDSRDYDYNLIIRKFKSPKSCLEIKEIIENLQTNEIIAFAAYTYKGGFCIGLDCTELMSYCNEFLVSLNDTSNIHELHNLVDNTNTWIEEEKESYVVIGVDKNSQGNALQMANYFYESGVFHFAHPNFHYFDLE